MKMQRLDYYFMSVGEKSYFYTLNYAYTEAVYRSNEHGTYIADSVQRFAFIQNLSHDFDEAVLKAKKKWHENSDTSAPLKLLEAANSMSERELSEYKKRAERLERGILIGGKYSNQQVATLPKSYVFWIITHIYNPNLIDDEQNLNAQICFNHAHESGWINEWVQATKNHLFPENQNEILNAKVTSTVMTCGNYSGEDINDFLYTKKKTYKKASMNYLEWFSEQVKPIDEMFFNLDIPPVKDETGQRYLTITSKDYLAAHKELPSAFLLNAIAVKNFLAKKTGNPKAVMYRFDWQYLSIPTHELIKYCPRHLI